MFICLRIVEIFMFITGLYGLMVGRIKLTKQITMEGKRARIASLFFIAPLPIILLLIAILKPDIGAPLGSPQEKILLATDAANPILVAVGLLGAIAYAAITRPKTSKEAGMESKKRRGLSILYLVLGLLSIGLFFLPIIANTLSTMNAIRQGLPALPTEKPSPYFSCFLFVGLPFLYAAFRLWRKDQKEGKK